MTTQPVTTNESDNTSVSKLIQPLVEALKKYADNPRDETEVVPFTFQGQEVRSHEAYVELDMYAKTPDQLLRALWTILERSESCAAWLNFSRPDPQNACGGPIAFALVQQRYGSGALDLHSYLWCYCRDEDFDVEATKLQVSHLVGLIRDSDNLVELTSQLRMRL